MLPPKLLQAYLKKLPACMEIDECCFSVFQFMSNLMLC